MNHGINALGTPLALEDRERLSIAVASLSEKRVATAIGVARSTLPRALAGLGIRNGTALQIRQWLDSHEAEG
jgi:hypothetical protein